MSQTKFKLPKNVRGAVICHCQGYADMKQWYDETYASIDRIGGECDGQPKGGVTSKPTENRAVTLATLDGMIRTQIMRAIEQARNCIGNDLKSDSLRTRLQTAIWESTLEPRYYPYEVWDLPTVYRDDFYERKRKFLHMIANLIGLI